MTTAREVGPWPQHDSVGENSEPRLTHGQFGMLAFLASEAAFFGTLIIAYLKYLGQDTSGPVPSTALHLGTAALNTVFLVSSSFTIACAATALAHGRNAAARGWLVATMLLGVAFLALTGVEWWDLIFRQGLTLRRNLFGTTYFTLIGFHAAHVTIGLLAMLIMLLLLGRRATKTSLHGAVELTSWYWHFVDGVWIVILMVVYVFGR